MPARVLRIGIDIDDVLIHSATKSIELYNRSFGTHLSLDDWYAFDDPSTYGPIWGTSDDVTLVKRVVATLVDDEFLDVEPVEGAQEGLRHLKEQGHQLYAVTGRSESIQDHTKLLLDKHFTAIFDDETLFFVDHFGHDGKKSSKADVALQLGLTHFVEDLPDHVNGLAGVGIKTVLLNPGDYKWSKSGINTDVSSNIIALDSWRQVIRYLDAEAA